MALAPLFLGPEFQLGACWNRLVEAVKTRNKREKTGKKWARYGLKRVNKEGTGGINWRFQGGCCGQAPVRDITLRDLTIVGSGANYSWEIAWDNGPTGPSAEGYQSNYIMTAMQQGQVGLTLQLTSNFVIVHL